MEYKAYIEKMRQIQKNMILFLDDEEQESIFFQINFYEGLNDDEEKKYRLKEILHLILHIANNHHRSSNFYKKIDTILNHFKEDMIKNFSSYELFNIFSTNKRVILHLIKEKIIQFDSRFLKIFLKSEKDYFYFLPEISKSPIENDSEHFQLNRKNGENESQICEIIRKDSLEEFINFVEQQNISLIDTKIEPTIFETNLFLIDKQPTLIEYSAFFGSFQIFKYLSQKVKLTSSLWLYAIHGNSKELIHILEQNHVKPGFLKSKELLIESIKCYHDDITKYIQKSIYKKEIAQSMIIPYYNYEYIDVGSIQKNTNEFISNDYIELFSNAEKQTDKSNFQWQTILIPALIVLSVPVLLKLLYNLKYFGFQFLSFYRLFYQIFSFLFYCFDKISIRFNPKSLCLLSLIIIL